MAKPKVTKPEGLALPASSYRYLPVRSVIAALIDDWALGMSTNIESMTTISLYRGSILCNKNRLDLAAFVSSDSCKSLHGIAFEVLFDRSVLVENLTGTTY